jgi:hypothetical protein
MNTITYNGCIAPENDLFKLEISDTGFPVQMYASSTGKYSTIQHNNSILNQADIRVHIDNIDFGQTTTTVYCNSANLLASNIKFDDIYYYYKWPLARQANIAIDGILTTNKDNNFVYINDNNQHTISYQDDLGNILQTETLITPFPVFINKDYIDIFANNPLFSSNTYSVSQKNDSLVVVFNKANVSVIAVDASIFDVQVSLDDFYPWISYFPFYVSMTVDGSTILKYDYSSTYPTIKTINGIKNYFYPNQCRLFDYTGSDLIYFRENKFYTYITYVGFMPTSYNNTSYPRKLDFVVTVQDIVLYISSQGGYIDSNIANLGNPYGLGLYSYGVYGGPSSDEPSFDFGTIVVPTISDTTIFSSNAIVKNPLNLDFNINNIKPALINNQVIFEDTIKSIDKNISKKILPRYFLLSANNSKHIFQNIVGQKVEYLTPFIFINSDRKSDTIFTFDISGFSQAIDSNIGSLLSTYVYDYTQNNPTKDLLLKYKSFVDTQFNYKLNIDNIFIFVSNDRNTFVPIGQYYYTGSIDNTLSTLTIRFETNILSQYSYLTLGFLDNLDSTKFILSKNILEL